ncbi:MAG: hypothetical protein AAFU38_18705 [Bacteroidota bacterium]
MPFDIGPAASLSVSIAALVISAISLRRSSRRDEHKRSMEAARLHQLFWSAPLDGDRQVVSSLLDDDIEPLLESYTRNTSEWVRERRAVARIGYFFSDIDSLIEHDVVDSHLARKLLHDAHFLYFDRLFVPIAQRAGSEVGWIDGVRSLRRRWIRRN